MSRPQMPGFSYDAKKKVAKFSIYAKGGGGKVRRERTVKVSSVEEARKKYAAFRDEVSMEALPTDVTFAAFVVREFPRLANKVKPVTAKWYRSILDSRLLPYFGSMQIRSITKAAAEDFQETCKRDTARPVSPARINGCIRVLKLLLHVAADRGYIASYPLAELDPVPEKLPECEFTASQQAAFLATFSDEDAFMADLETRMPKGRVVEINGGPLKTTKRRLGAGMKAWSAASRAFFSRFSATKQFFHIAILTGIRKEDLRLLTWSQVDLQGRWIRVTQQKTGEPVSVPITDACYVALTELRRRSAVGAHVFVNERGRVLSNMTVRRYFVVAKRLASITERRRFHDLRHTFGHNAVSAGIPLAFVKAAMGHSTVKMTERYSRPDDEAVQRAFLARK